MKGCRVGVTKEERVGQCQDGVTKKERDREERRSQETRIGR